MSPRPSKHAEFVHEYTVLARDGTPLTRYAVAEWQEREAQYIWPLPKAHRSGGTYAGYARRAQDSDWRYTTRAAALAAARRLFILDTCITEDCF